MQGKGLSRYEPRKHQSFATNPVTSWGQMSIFAVTYIQYIFLWPAERINWDSKTSHHNQIMYRIKGVMHSYTKDQFVHELEIPLFLL